MEVRGREEMRSWYSVRWDMARMMLGAGRCGSACNPCFALFGFFQGLSGCDFDDGVGGGSEERGQGLLAFLRTRSIRIV